MYQHPQNCGNNIGNSRARINLRDSLVLTIIIISSENSIKTWHIFPLIKLGYHCFFSHSKILLGSHQSMAFLSFYSENQNNFHLPLIF